jgi:hypothetical protein
MYHPYPANYRQQQPQAEAAPIPAKRLTLARRVNASNINAAGDRVYRFQSGRWEYADWRGDDWGSWWECEEFPEATKL